MPFFPNHTAESVQLGDTVRLGMTFVNPSGNYKPFGGAAPVNSDVTPIWQSFRNDSDTVVQTGNFALRTGFSGCYRANLVVSSANGYNAGDYVEIIASGKYLNVSDVGIIKAFVINGIQSGIWSAVQANYQSGPAGSTLTFGSGLQAGLGAVLNSNVVQFGGSGLNTATYISDRIWNALESNYTANGTFGSGEQSALGATFNANITQIGGSGLLSSTYIRDQVWNANLQNYSGVNTAGLYLNLSSFLAQVYSVQDNSPSSSKFITNFTGASGATAEESVLFISGPLFGQVKIASDYNSNTKTFIFDEAFTGPPNSGDTFALLSLHTHTDTEIQGTIWNALLSNYTANGTFGSGSQVSLGAIVNANVLQVGGSGVQMNPIVPANLVQIGGSGVNLAGTVPANVTQISGSPIGTTTYVADQVWQAQESAYNGTGTFGSGINKVSQDIFFADIKVVNGSPVPNNEYSIIWYWNNTECASGVVINPALTVYNTTNGVNLITNQPLANAGVSLSALYWIEPTNRMASGIPYLAITSGIIGGSTQIWKKIIGLDYM